MWFFYSLFFAIWSAIAVFITKRLTGHFQPLPLLFIVFLFYLPSTFIVMLLTGGIPHATQNFYIYMFISAVLDTIAFISYYHAISLSPISLVTPIQSFAPILTTIIAVTALGESPSLLKLVGIILIVQGVYLLNVSDIKNGIFSPIKNLISNKGVRLSFLSTILWAVTPIFQKKALFEISPQVPLFASFIGIFFVTLMLAPLAFRKTLNYRKKIPANYKWFLLFGIGGALAQLAAYKSFTLTYVGYSTAVFKTSIFFVVLLGGIFLKEKRFAERLIATLIMLAGVALLVI